MPGQIGLAGFNGVELLQGLPKQLATMDACRFEIGQKAAEIILQRSCGGGPEPSGTKIELTPKISAGNTLIRS